MIKISNLRARSIHSELGTSIQISANIAPGIGYYVLLPINDSAHWKESNGGIQGFAAELHNALKTLEFIIQDPLKAKELGMVDFTGPIPETDPL